MSSTLGGWIVDRAGVDLLFLIGGAGALAWSLLARSLLDTGAPAPLRGRRVAAMPPRAPAS